MHTVILPTPQAVSPQVGLPPVERWPGRPSDSGPSTDACSARVGVRNGSSSATSLEGSGWSGTASTPAAQLDAAAPCRGNARGDSYGATVRVSVLLFAETGVAKLAVHAITPEEVRQINDGDRIFIANPRPRVEGSLLMIGPTHGGRVLTVVLNPVPSDPGVWHVRTAWEASVAQVRRYRRDR